MARKKKNQDIYLTSWEEGEGAPLNGLILCGHTWVKGRAEETRSGCHPPPPKRNAESIPNQSSPPPIRRLVAAGLPYKAHARGGSTAVTWQHHKWALSPSTKSSTENAKLHERYEWAHVNIKHTDTHTRIDINTHVHHMSWVLLALSHMSVCTLKSRRVPKRTDERMEVHAFTYGRTRIACVLACSLNMSHLFTFFSFGAFCDMKQVFFFWHVVVRKLLLLMRLLFKWWPIVAIILESNFQL